MAYKVDRIKAKLVSEIFRECPLVTSVEIFGSVARNGEGNDLDLILITEREQAFAWLSAARSMRDAGEYAERVLAGIAEYAPSVPPSNAGGTHVALLTPIFGKDMTRLVRRAERVIDPGGHAGKRMDLFVLWPDWRDEAQQVAALLPQRDPNFWKHIATEAITI